MRVLLMDKNVVYCCVFVYLEAFVESLPHAYFLKEDWIQLKATHQSEQNFLCQTIRKNDVFNLAWDAKLLCY